MRTLYRGNPPHCDKPALPSKAPPNTPLHELLEAGFVDWELALGEPGNAPLVQASHPVPEIRKARLRHQPDAPRLDDPHFETFAHNQSYHLALLRGSRLHHWLPPPLLGAHTHFYGVGFYASAVLRSRFFPFAPSTIAKLARPCQPLRSCTVALP